MANLSSLCFIIFQYVGQNGWTFLNTEIHFSELGPTTTVPTLHWTENDIFPSAVVSVPKSTSITSTLKDYRPPKMMADIVGTTLSQQPLMGLGQIGVANTTVTPAPINLGTRPEPQIKQTNIGTSSSGRYATTIYKCQVCTKAFATMAFLEEHMKTVHVTAIGLVSETKSNNPPGGASVNNIAFNIKEPANLRKDKTNNATLECSSCHKILPSKEALKSHFQVMIKVTYLQCEPSIMS